MEGNTTGSFICLNSVGEDFGQTFFTGSWSGMGLLLGRALLWSSLASVKGKVTWKGVNSWLCTWLPGQWDRFSLICWSCLCSFIFLWLLTLPRLLWNGKHHFSYSELALALGAFKGQRQMLILCDKYRANVGRLKMFVLKLISRKMSLVM